MLHLGQHLMQGEADTALLSHQVDWLSVRKVRAHE